MSVRFTKRRNKLMAKDPHCYWCGQEVIWFRKTQHGPFPDNFATLDHLNDRLLGDRPNLGMVVTTVLSCRKCNQSRASVKQAGLPREILWEKSGRKPRMLPIKEKK